MMLIPVSAVGRLFFTVMIRAPLVVPTVWAGKVRLAGVTATGAIPVPFSVAELHTDPSHAVIVAVPPERTNAVPRLVVSFVIEATLVFEELHVTDWSACVVESLKVPVATKVCDVPIGTAAFVGVTVIETRFDRLSVGGR